MPLSGYHTQDNAPVNLGTPHLVPNSAYVGMVKLCCTKYTSTFWRKMLFKHTYMDKWGKIVQKPDVKPIKAPSPMVWAPSCNISKV